MHTKMAGHLSLHDMIAGVISDSREKLAADEKKEEKKDGKKPPPFMAKKKNDHDGDDKKEEKGEKEKDASIDFSDPDDIEKLASALDHVGEKIAGDSTYIGGEKKQGGEVLATMSKVPGKQPYKKDSSKSHNIPASTPLKSAKDDKGATTATETDDEPSKILKYTHSKYPEKGVLKTAAASVKEKIEAAKAKEQGEEPEAPEAEAETVEEPAEKKSAALEFVLGKVAAFGAVEKKQGGETLDSASGQGPKPATGSSGGNNARSHIGSNKAAIDMKKVDGKGPQKKMLSEVLTEPALSKAHDSKVSENLRNATKGGVKIAAAKAFLQKIAEEGCTCDGKGECKYCKMKKSLEKKSQAGAGTETVPPPAAKSSQPAEAGR